MIVGSRRKQRGALRTHRIRQSAKAPRNCTLVSPPRAGTETHRRTTRRVAFLATPAAEVHALNYHRWTVPPISVSLVRCELSSVNISTCLLLSARSAGVRPWLSRASSDAPASRRYAAHLVCPRTAAQCSGVRSPSASRALTLYPSASRACDRRPAGKRSRLGLLKSSPRVTLETP